MTVERMLTEHGVDAPLMAFELATMIRQMKAEPTWETSNRNAMTLLKDHALRVVLVAMRAGERIPSHRTDGPITVQVLDGRLRFTAGSREVALEPGRIVTLAPEIDHDLVAIDECAFLLTVGAERTHPAEDRATPRQPT